MMQQMKAIISFTSVYIFVSLVYGTSNYEQDKSFEGMQVMEQVSNQYKIKLEAKELSDLDAAASDRTVLTTNSHKIVATGWPSTSPMWPSIETDAAEGQTAEANSTQWSNLLEPFIYADKHRLSADYSLLLALNKTVLNKLKSHLKPMTVNLSFEYYFNYKKDNTALPGIKIEVDRKEFKYLVPTGAPIKAQMWMKFDEKIPMIDLKKLDNNDWLKFSLVIRQSPSLVAIRRLKVEFLMSKEAKVITPRMDAPAQLLSPIAGTTQTQEPEIYETSPPIKIPKQHKKPTHDDLFQQIEPVQPNPDPNFPAQNEFPTNIEIENSAPLRPKNDPDPNRNNEDNYNNGRPIESPSYNINPGRDYTKESATSDILNTQIVPVKPKITVNGAGFSDKKRRKRDTSSELVTANQSTDAELSHQNIVLTCYRSDQCDWTASDPNETIQWSLARMPPSTNTVDSGYYYVSNRNNYGDSTKMLRLYLNQTDSSTIADKNSDHCIELALYITEKTYLNLYRLTKQQKPKSDNDDDSWVKGNLLLTWAPTMATTSEINGGEKLSTPWRSYLPNTRLTAMKNGQNGWIRETLCYGDFFVWPNECGEGQCAFGLEMKSELSKHQSQLKQQQAEATQTKGELVELVRFAEQVVGVSLLNEYSLNIPFKVERRKWLETWERDEVKPDLNWKFYPKLDYKVNSNNISLLNLYDGAHYHIESEWLNMSSHLELTAFLAVELSQASKKNDENIFDQYNLYQTKPQNSVDGLQVINDMATSEEPYVFSLKTTTKFVDSKFDTIQTNNSEVVWSLNNYNSTLFNLSIPLTEHILNNQDLIHESNDNVFKIIIEFVLDCHWIIPDTTVGDQLLSTINGTSYILSLVNVSLSDRCFPNPCQFGSCKQNDTGFEDLNCDCDEKHRGRRCNFGRWCNLPHVTPWIEKKQHITLRIPTPIYNTQRKSKMDTETRVSGKEYCLMKLGPGFKCTDIDLKLDDNLYTEDDTTFSCSCQDDYYLSDNSTCTQVHLCNSVLCPTIGMICDETKPFNQTQPCHCNEKQDWYPDPKDPNKCIRRQCQDKERDCQFDAHICLPTLPGEKPICKCGPKFTLKINNIGQKYCQSVACVLPTLNDCDQVCMADNSNLHHPYTCSCHPGYELDRDGRTCRSQISPKCKPSCNSETQICTDVGCKCKKGYVGEGEVIVQQVPKNRLASHNHNDTVSPIDYIHSVRCLNVCSLTYAENKEKFEMVESVCPLGLCDTTDFHCLCADTSSSALINTKYEPIYTNYSSLLDHETEEKKRISPLCHLRRVCEPSSSSYKICKSQGAICVPDYMKPAMFDCICPPSTDKKFHRQGTNNEFTCEPLCNAKKKECLRQQAVCNLVDKDETRCDCLPGFDKQDEKCYLTKYSYSFNITVVNKYYEPESKFHRLEVINTTIENFVNGVNGLEYKNDGYNSEIDERELEEMNLSFGRSQSNEVSKSIEKSIFIIDYNQCNITQVIPKSVIEDPYEHDTESFLGYIDQCNEKIHQNDKTYRLNSRLSEDLRQSIRQHIRDFTVITNNSTCTETDSTGMYLNCQVYLQSNEPIPAETVNYVFSDCDKHGQHEKYCWIKPRLLLKRPVVYQNMITSKALNYNETQPISNELNFHQIVPCELNNFCGPDAYSVRTDDKTSLCSCKCPHDIEIIDVKDLEPTRHDSSKVSVKEICAPRNHCGDNSSFCNGKSGSVCQYDIKLGSKCNCVHPFDKDPNDEHCVEVAFSLVDNTLIIIIIMLGTGFVVSIGINLIVLSKSKKIFGRSKDYPLNEFHPSRPTNRSTGVPNLSFTND